MLSPSLAGRVIRSRWAPRSVLASLWTHEFRPVLVFASFSLFDLRLLREIWRIDRIEVGLSVITTLGVVAVGAINAILIAVALALVRFVKLTARPRDEVLGKVVGLSGFHSRAVRRRVNIKKVHATLGAVAVNRQFHVALQKMGPRPR